jgi:hypothetical protein
MMGREDRPFSDPENSDHIAVDKSVLAKTGKGNSGGAGDGCILAFSLA